MAHPKELRKDQYVLCKYNGDNGDLIVGRIESVRRGGDVLLTNLLTGNRSVKKSEVLLRRNVVVHKKYADEVVRRGKEHGAKEARQLAVAVVRDLEIESSEEVRIVGARVLVFKNTFCAEDCTYLHEWSDEAFCYLFDVHMLKKEQDDHFSRCSLCLSEEIPRQPPTQGESDVPRKPSHHRNPLRHVGDLGNSRAPLPTDARVIRCEKDSPPPSAARYSRRGSSVPTSKPETPPTGTPGT